MTLDADVKARYSTQRLIELTNPGAPGALGIDQTRLTNAEVDAQADIKIYAGIAFDDTVDTHIAVAVQGVEAYLLMRSGIASEIRSRLFTEWVDRVKDLAKITARDRISPDSTSVLEPSSEASATGQPVRPDFDRRRFSEMIPSAPREGPNIFELFE